MSDEKFVTFLKISQGMMNSVRKGSKKSVHKGANFHPTSTRVFRGPPNSLFYKNLIACYTV